MNPSNTQIRDRVAHMMTDIGNAQHMTATSRLFQAVYDQELGNITWTGEQELYPVYIRHEEGQYFRLLPKTLVIAIWGDAGSDDTGYGYASLSYQEAYDFLVKEVDG